MSGGSYDYAYQKTGCVSEMAETLEDMAAECRKRSAEATAKHVETKPGVYSYVPVTAEDRARAEATALRLETVAVQLRKAHEDLVGVEDLMKTVEWICSGDWGVDSLFEDPKQNLCAGSLDPMCP
jgi:hypothetical protein